MHNKSILPVVFCLLYITFAGCITCSPSSPCESVDFRIEIDGAAEPDIKKCEMFYWDRPVRKGALEHYQEYFPRVAGGGIEIDEKIGFEGYGYGYEVLAGAVKDNGYRIGAMTYLIKGDRRVKEYGFDKSRPDTYVKIASNAVDRLGIRRSPIDSSRYYFKRKETDPADYAEAQFWPQLAGINSNGSYDEILPKLSFMLSSCARFYAFPDLPTIRIAPEYTYRMRFGSWYHSFAVSYHPSMADAAMRFYGFDGKMFAIIRHDVPRNTHGDFVLQYVRCELVRYLITEIGKGNHGHCVIKGSVRHHANDGGWLVIVDEIQKLKD